MNPLARLLRARGHHVQGSDRALDQGQMIETATLLRREGIVLLPHDGSAVTAGIDRLVYSTAVEAETPELKAARALRIDLIPRPSMLADLVNAGRPGVAISGTCGKSTVTGMVGWLAEQSGCAATVIGGAPRVGEGIAGGLLAGPEHGPVIAEACESDGTLTGYRPAIGVIHNVSRDHAELDSLRAQFATFARQCGRLFVNAGCPEAVALGQEVSARTYGTARDPDALLRVMSTDPDRARGTLALADLELALEVPQPGLHNLENAAAAALVAGFVWIIDDYAIDPETVRWAAWAVTLFAGLTMVSNLKYYSFKTINLRRSVPFAVVILIVLFIVLISYQPSVVPFAGFVVYAISGFIWSAWLALKRRRG